MAIRNIIETINEIGIRTGLEYCSHVKFRSFGSCTVFMKENVLVLICVEVSQGKGASCSPT